MTILKSNDYDKFQLLDWNRPIQHDHVLSLKMNMQQDGYDNAYPIKVSRSLEIIEGQHRFLAAKEAGVEVHYVITDEEVGQSILKHQTLTKFWRKDDFLHHWKQRGNPHYLSLHQLITRYNLSIDNAIGACLKGGRRDCSAKAFMNGKFEMYYSLQDCEEIILKSKTIVDHIKMCRGRKGKFTNAARFWEALYHFLRIHKIDIEEFNRKIDMRGSAFSLKLSKTEYVQMFVECYNYSRRVAKI